jgi:hypothetical protein
MYNREGEQFVAPMMIGISIADLLAGNYSTPAHLTISNFSAVRALTVTF